MGMIRRADIESYTREATVMNLGDLHQQGQTVVRVASERAEQLIKDAQSERDQLVAGAAEQGREQGHSEGHTKGFEQGQGEGLVQALEQHSERIEQITKQWEEMLSAFNQARDEMYQQARRDVVQLAVQIAERITKRMIATDPGVVEAQMQSVLETLARPTGLVLRVHPDDLAYAETILPGLIADCMNCTHAEVTADNTLDPGSCIAETEGRGVIDGSIKTQLDRIVEALLPNQTGTDAQSEMNSETAKDDAA